MQPSVSSPPPLPLFFKVTSLTEVVLPTQRQAAQGQPKVLGPTRLLLAFATVDRDAVKLMRTAALP